MDLSQSNPEQLDVSVMAAWREGHRDFTFLQQDHVPAHALATHFEEGISAEEAWRQARLFRDTVVTRVYTGQQIPFHIRPS